MLTKQLPVYEDNKEAGVYREVPRQYSRNIVQLMEQLLRKQDDMRPEVKQLFQEDYVLRGVENLQREVVMGKEEEKLSNKNTYIKSKTQII